MAHYALLNADKKVIAVITGVDESITQTNTDGTLVGGSTEAWETFYAAQPWHGAVSCKRTSYNTSGGTHIGGGTPYRVNYAGIGYTYDTVRDAFIAAKPFASWVLNETTCSWAPSVARPATGQWMWDEASLSWVAL